MAVMPPERVERLTTVASQEATAWDSFALNYPLENTSMSYGIDATSDKLERFAKQIGFWAFNRWCRNQGIPMDQCLCVVRAVFRG